MKKFYSFLILGLATLSLSAQTYNGGTWYSIYDTKQYDNVVVTSTIAEYKSIFAPTAGLISMDYKKYSIATINGSIEVFESTNNGSSTTSKGKIGYSDYKNWNNGSKAVSANINYISLKNTSTGVSVKNVKLAIAQHILLADGTYGTTAYEDAFDFGSVKWGATATAVDEIALRSFLTAGNITITSSLPNVFRINSADNTQGVTYNVGANAFACSKGSEGTPCSEGTIGDINLYGFKIYFCPQEAKSYTGTITISDGTSSATIAVKGKGLKQDQTITFEPASPIYDSATIAPAVASSGLDVEYTFDPENIIFWDGSKFMIKSLSDSAQVTIMATQTGDNKYNAAPAVARTITIYPSKTYGTYAAAVCPGEQVEFYGKQYGAGEHKNILITDKNRFGSDSLVTLTVTELPTYLFDDDFKVMYVGKDSTWRGKDLSTYPEGQHIVCDSLQTINGCDSVYVLYLYVLPLPVIEGFVEATVCEGDAYEFKGQFYNKGVYDSIPVAEKNIYGGDSVVTLTVKEFEPVEDIYVYDTTYVGDPIEVAGQFYTFQEAGDTTIIDSLTTIHGCDSVIYYEINIQEKVVPTAIDQADKSEITNNQSKIIKDGHLYIRREETLFDVLGNKVN